MNKFIDFNKIETINVDFIVGFGGDCRVAQALNRNNLRYFSGPFDWVMEYSLDVAYNLMRSVAKGEKLNFFANCYHNRKYDTEHHFGMVDSNNGIISMHDFPKNKSILEAPEFFYLKYLKRFQRLDNMLQKANSVCFFTNRKISLDEMKKFVSSMRELYELNHLFYVNVYDTQEEYFEKIEENGVTYLMYKFNDEHKNGRNPKMNPDFWLGNIEYWDKILSKIKLNDGLNNVRS